MEIGNRLHDAIINRIAQIITPLRIDGQSIRRVEDATAHPDGSYTLYLIIAIEPQGLAPMSMHFPAEWVAEHVCMAVDE